jgi:hypothetical protein
MSNNSDFKILTNGIDNNIKIIQHIPTNYYNITKINNYIFNQNNQLNEPTRIRVGSKNQKLINNWTRNKCNQELVNELKNQLNTTDELIIILEENIPFKYKGTYVHRLLYDHILIWIEKYAIKISLILDNIHKNANIEKDNLIKELKNQNNTLLTKIDQQSDKIDKLLNYSKEIKEQNENLEDKADALEDKLDNINDKVEDIKEVFKETANRSVPKHNIKCLNSEFILFQDKYKLNNFQFIRGINKR